MTDALSLEIGVVLVWGCDSETRIDGQFEPRQSVRAVTIHPSVCEQSGIPYRQIQPYPTPSPLAVAKQIVHAEQAGRLLT